MSRQPLPYRELRRYALSGRLEQAGKLLRRILERDPEDPFARGEYSRLKRGEALVSARPVAEFKKAVRMILTARLEGIPLKQPESSLRRLPTDQLRALDAKLRELMQWLEDSGGSCPPEVRSYARSVSRELTKRWFRTHKKQAAVLALCALLVPVFAGSTCYLAQRAEDAAQALDQAVLIGQWQEVNALRHAADTGVYRLLHPAIGTSIYNADTWIIHKRHCYNLAERRLAPIRRGERSVESMSLRERADMERELKDIPPGLDDLTPVWSALCRKEAEKLAHAWSVELARLREPLPGWPEWASDPDTDATMLRSTLERTEERYRDYQDAVLAYHLSEDELAPLQKRIADIKGRLAAIDSIRSQLEDMDKAVDAKQYTAALSRKTDATWYPPATALAEAQAHMPEQEGLRLLMANRDGLLPQGFVAEAFTTFLEAGPTFTANNPATSQQVELLEDLFTSQTLRTRLLELKDETGHYAYTTDKLDFAGKDFITFSRHALDPAYKLRDREEQTWKTRGLRYRDIDVSPLVQAVGLERRTFYVQTNIPHALGVAASAEAKDCPALARAFIYDRLLQVLMAHPDRKLIGVKFSPGLQEDSFSFMNLRDNSGITLAPGCWLAPSESMREAEEKFRRWFQQHRNRDYAKEIAENFGKEACVHPRFAGYIDFHGHLKPCISIPKDAEVWYTGKDGTLRHAPKPENGAAWEDAAPYSPLYTMERDTSTD